MNGREVMDWINQAIAADPDVAGTQECVLLGPRLCLEFTNDNCGVALNFTRAHAAVERAISSKSGEDGCEVTAFEAWDLFYEEAMTVTEEAGDVEEFPF